MSPDIGNLSKGKLPGCHDALRAEPVPEERGSIVCRIGLGTDMQVDIGAARSGQIKHAGIRYQYPVRADVPKKGEVLPGFLKICIVRIDIGRHIYFFPVLMGESDSFSHFIFRKILRFSPEAHHFPADVDGVSPV